MAIVKERGLKRHLDREVTLEKGDNHFCGILKEDGEGKYFVAPSHIWNGEGGRKCKKDTAKVYVNRPGKDKIFLMGYDYCVGNGTRTDQFREFDFESLDPVKYRAERKSLSEFTPKITDRGLGNSKNWLNFCAIRKPSGKGGYGPIQSGLIVGDKEEGFGLIWEGSGKTVMIEDWDRVILTQKSSDGGTHHRHYTYRKI